MVFSTLKAISRIQKFRRAAGYLGIYCGLSFLTFSYTNISTRAGISRADQFYSSYPAGVDLLFDATKLYKAALSNVFEIEEWGPVEFSMLMKHFQRQGKEPYAYHAEFEMKHLLLGVTSSILLAMKKAGLFRKGFNASQQYMAHLLSGGQLDGTGV